MFENRSEEERKKIFWLTIISITALVFIIWLILLIKGLVIRPNAKKPALNENNQTNFSQIKGELQNTLKQFKDLDFKKKINDFKDEIGNLQNSNTNQALENTPVNEEKTVNEPINEPVNDTTKPENQNTNSSPRLPIDD